MPLSKIQTAVITDNAITTAKVNADAITNAKLADDAIQTENVASSVNLGRRNLIINGSMQVAQRGTSSTGTGYQTVDRFAVNQSNFDNLVSTKTQDTSVPDGFSKSFKIATTTAETALASDEYANMSYAIEGQDLQSLAYGTSSAKSFTLSFYVKSNLTGNFSVTAYKQTGSNKLQDRQYTINSANTWERKTLTFVGDTAQAIVNSTGVGMYLYWHTAFGSGFGTATYNGNAGWSAYSNAGWGAGQDVNTLYNSTSNYLQFTGIQLEVGDTATEFEHLSFGEELALCKRYYEHSYPYGTAAGTANGGIGAYHIHAGASRGNNYAFVTQRYTVEKRAAGTVTVFSYGGQSGQMSNGDSGANIGAVGIIQNGATSFLPRNTSGSTLSDQALIYHYRCDAEL